MTGLFQSYIDRHASSRSHLNETCLQCVRCLLRRSLKLEPLFKEPSMHHPRYLSVLAAALVLGAATHPTRAEEPHSDARNVDPQGKHGGRSPHTRQAVQIGDRPFYLIDGLENGKLKTRLEQCER